MSLINQVLQDLEKRHALDPDLKSLPPQVRVVSRTSKRGAYAVAWMLGVSAIVVVAGVLYFRNLSNKPVNTAPPPIVAAPSPPPAAPLKPQPMPAAPPEAQVQAVLLAPASKLSQELSYVPNAPARRPQASNPAPLPRTNRSAAGQAETVPPPAALPSRPHPEPQQVVAAVPAAPASQPEPQSAAPQELPAGIDKQMREVPPQQRAELLFRKGVALLQEGRVAAAEAIFREALKEDPPHVAARQALLGLLLDNGRNDEAEQLLRRALELNPRQPRHAMVLARLEVERGEVSGAINTLVGALPYVRSDPDYYAFLAALLQRESRHREAIDYYRAALQSAPGNAVWMMGMGMALRANNQLAEAREAFQRAAESRQLNSELQVYVERQLRELSVPKK
jgi:MSHA biogenesis protein MshN